MHRDACNSSRNHTSFRWGHCWVVLCLLIPSRSDPQRKFAIPILMRLYLNQKTNEKLRRKHRKKTELMLEMIQTLANHAHDKKLHFLGDSAYTCSRLLGQISPTIHVTGRLGLDARLCDAPPPRTGKRGRPCRRGKLLPNPQQMLNETGLRRLKLKLYQNTIYSIRITSVVCRLYLAPERAVKVVAIEHLRGGRGKEVFYSTDVSLSEEEILQRYSYRWPIETTFQDSKGHLGLGEPQNRKAAAVRRTTPSMFYLYSLIVLWHEHVRATPGSFVRLWRGKRFASFADMLATLRRDSLQETRESIFCAGEIPPGIEKILRPLELLLELAA
jgi:DDE superfamily endonuclease